MAARPLLAAFRCRCTLLIRFRSATAALRVVSCRAAVHSLGRGCRPEHSLCSHPDCGGTGNVGWPRTTARGLGRTLRQFRPQHHRPTQPGALSTAGNENKAGDRGQRIAPPGHLAPLAWLGGSSRSFPAVAAPAPWTPKARVHSPSSLPPEPPIPPEWRCRPSGGPLDCQQ